MRSKTSSHKQSQFLKTLTNDNIQPSLFSFKDSLAGLVVKAFALGVDDPGFKSRLQWDFSGLSHTSDLKLALQWLPCQAPGIIGSVLGLVNLVSVYCDWVR